jgi:glycosyltransferase involved in cell wall biosynthesis
VHVPFMLIGYLLSKLYCLDYIAIWTDPPSVRSERDSFLKSRLRYIELFVSKLLMRKASKVVSVTKHLAQDFAPQKPYLVIEGIIDQSEIIANRNEENRKDCNSNEIKIVYTGSLSKRYGVKNIVEGFKLVKDDNILLEIYGRGDYEKELTEVCSKNNKIIYKGFVSNEEARDAQRKADFLINARSANDEYTKYTFPSKTLEYMLSGTPLITTLLPGMPENYKDYLLLLENNDPKTICEMLQNAIKLDRKQRNSIGYKALKFAKSKNYKNQGEKITKFILGLGS